VLSELGQSPMMSLSGPERRLLRDSKMSGVASEADIAWTWRKRRG
jgi:hypothetical protein